MKPNRRGWARAVLALVFCCAPAGSAPGQDALKGCPLEIEGIWKPQVTVETQPVLLSFSTDGWVSLLEGAAETRAQDFDVAAQVRYRFDASPTSLRIAFQTGRGNDVFLAGTSWWEVAEYSDTAFTILNRESGERSYWARVQTHRYFLTLAARRGSGSLRGAAFVMWTRFDGQKIDLEALGTVAGRGAAPAVFGRIPAALAAEFASERDDDGRVLLRIELSEAEYRRTRAAFAIWDERARKRTLAGVDPYALAAEFVNEAIERLNRCGTKIELPDARVLAPEVDARDLPQRLLAFVRWLRTTNESRHLTDGRFPAAWKPQPAF